MIQTLEAEIDEKGAVRLAQPAHFDRKHRVLVMVIPDQPREETDDSPDDWNHPYIDHPLFLPFVLISALVGHECVR